MRSTSADKPPAVRLWSVAVWLLAWHGLSAWLGQEILMVSPVSVLLKWVQLVTQADFWSTVFFSLRRIASGFFLAAGFGVVFASAAARFRRLNELLSPAIFVLNTTPVASITILMLIWVSSRNLSVLISFAMVLPVIYTNVLNGIRSADTKLLEMADVFGVSSIRRVVYIYVSQVLPFFRSACSIALGMCWKSGIAAEVIGIPDGSIGEKLYKAKIYLDTPDLFAWTLTIILMSVLFERLIMLLIRLMISRLERL